MKKLFLTICLALVAFTINASLLPSVTLEWDANTEPELKGYAIYIQEDNGDYTWLGEWDEIELSNPLLPRVTIQGLEPRDFYYFYATAYSDTQESVFSNQACGKLLDGRYVDCDYQEPKPDPPKKKKGGGGGCFISVVGG